MIQEHPKILWQPSRDMIQNSHIHHFMDWLDRSQGLKFDHYDQLWQWSVDHMEDF
jgi:acetoacetyl-CoA synthetase